MGYTDFLVAIDLGTAWLTGMVGKKNASGTLTVIAAETEPSVGCIRRGCVYNVEETAVRINNLLRKLSDKLNDARIAKVYVGIGGQSLRSIDYSVSRRPGSEGVVTKELIDALYEEARRYRPELSDVLAVASPVYLLDNRPEANPAGIPCDEIKAQYKLITARPSLRRYATMSATGKSKAEIADILVSPLAMADVVLNRDEKELGCALVDFGAGTTKVSVYKHGCLKGLCVIPLGGNTITKDIASLQIIESEAERIKMEYGCATSDLDEDTDILLFSTDGIAHPSVKQAELNMVIEARVREIIENVATRIESYCPLGELSAGVIITGGTSELKGLHRVFKERLRIDVRYATLRRGLLDETGLPIEETPGFTVTIGMLLQGTENCAAMVSKPVPETLFTPEEVPVETPKSITPPEPEKKQKTEKPEKPPKTPKKSIFDKFRNMGDSLFGDDEF